MYLQILICLAGMHNHYNPDTIYKWPQTRVRVTTCVQSRGQELWEAIDLIDFIKYCMALIPGSHVHLFNGLRAGCIRNKDFSMMELIMAAFGKSIEEGN